MLVMNNIMIMNPIPCVIPYCLVIPDSYLDIKIAYKITT